VLFALLLQAVVDVRPGRVGERPSWGEPVSSAPRAHTSTPIGVDLEVERVWALDDHAKALVSLRNRSSELVRWASVRCLAVDVAGAELGRGTWHLGPIAPGERTLGAVPVTVAPVRGGGARVEGMRCELLEQRAPEGPEPPVTPVTVASPS
jgi:hypothetical protein